MDTPAKVKAIVMRLQSLSDPKLLAYSKRLGINTEKSLGISVYELRKIAKEIGKDQVLAEALWKTEIHEARLLAGYIADPERLSEEVIEKWVADFDSWDLVDQVMDVIALSPYGYKKAVAFTERKEEFVKRTGFALMAWFAALDKKASDETLAQFFPIIVREATDERNFVKKAVNWALRNIGKRNKHLNQEAITTAKKIATIDSKAAKWIASNALKELTGDKVQSRLSRE